MVDLIAASYLFFTLSEKPVARKPLRIEAQIVVKVPGEASGKQNMLKRLVKRGVIFALPPDGGAAQAITT